MKRHETPNTPQGELKRFMHEANGMDLSEIWEPHLQRPKAAICPIFRQTDAGPEQFGSGVLVRIEQAHFLLTAAHVTEERKTNVLLVPAKKGFINLFGLFLESKLPPSGERDDDKADVAVVKLEPKLVTNLHPRLLFLEHADWGLADVTAAGDVYTIVGYPARKSGIEQNSIFTEQFSLSGEGVLDGRYEQLGIEPRRHVLVQCRFQRAVDYSTMRKKRPPHPEGMSGCGIFAWSKALPELSAIAQPKLIGILTEYHQQKNVFVGTRLHSHLMAIHRNDPSLPIIPR